MAQYNSASTGGDSGRGADDPRRLPTADVSELREPVRVNKEESGDESAGEQERKQPHRNIDSRPAQQNYGQQDRGLNRHHQARQLLPARPSTSTPPENMRRKRERDESVEADPQQSIKRPGKRAKAAAKWAQRQQCRNCGNRHSGGQDVCTAPEASQCPTCLRPHVQILACFQPDVDYARHLRGQQTFAAQQARTRQNALPPPPPPRRLGRTPPALPPSATTPSQPSLSGYGGQANDPGAVFLGITRALVQMYQEYGRQVVQEAERGGPGPMRHQHPSPGPRGHPYARRSDRASQGDRGRGRRG